MKYLCFILMMIINSGLIKIAHRGASGYAPENTLKSFKKALEFNIDMIELDVFKAKSNELVVIHDETLERTTNGKGRVENKNLTSLKKLDAGEGEQIPTLAEVIELVGQQVPINIELKGSNTEKLTADLLKKYFKKGWQSKDFVVSSFDHQQLQNFHKYLPEVSLGKLISGQLPKNIFENINGVTFFGIDKKYATAENINLIHSHALKVFVYTVNDQSDIDNLKNSVDGIFSNYPDRLTDTI